MKALVIAEKPSVARDIARVLKCGKNISGAIEGGQYIVTWGLGHLVTLADPEDYDPKYKAWKLDDLPLMPKEFKLEVIRQSQKQYQAVKAQIHRKDVGEIIIATDAGREGELVARLILAKAGSKKPIKRLWISSVTDKAIREGFAHLRSGHDYDPLYDAALCRAEADWLVGINATRALTCKYNAQLSCGRVQTPTLAIVAKREEQICSFVPQTYYGMRAAAKGLTLVWKDGKSGSTRTFDRGKIQNLKKELEGEEAVIREVKASRKKTYAPLLYDLTELQKDAYKKFGLSPKETLNIMQRLYENHKVLTYPRTDSRYISSDIVPTIKDRLGACAVGPYRKLAAKVMRVQVSPKASFVNDKKVSDHHAIIPTEQYVELTHMTNEERKIYDLVVRRFLAVLYPPAEYEEIQLAASVGREDFTAKGKHMLKEGWREVYDSDQEEEEDDEEDVRSQALPKLEKGSRISGLHLTVTEGRTKPPARFNEGTLLAAMENPAAYMESHDKKAAKTLANAVGADLYEIKPAVPYTHADLNWMDKNSRSSVEMNNKESRPALADKTAPVGNYDVIFLGFPIWWYVAPTIINTFLESYDFTGKTIILFATSGGSGLGKSADGLKCSAPGAKILDGRLLNGQLDEKDLKAWASGLRL